MSYSEDVLDMPTSFRFPETAVLLAMKALLVPKEDACPWCLGKTYTQKLGVKTFCKPCDGLGKRGGLGKNNNAMFSAPPAVYQVSERSRADYGLL